MCKTVIKRTSELEERKALKRFFILRVEGLYLFPFRVVEKKNGRDTRSRGPLLPEVPKVLDSFKVKG